MARRSKDMNHNEIARALIRAGCSVLDLSGVGNGCPDMLVGIRNENVLLEIKRPKEKGQTAGRLRESQERFFALWRGPVYKVHSAEDALRVLGLVG